MANGLKNVFMGNWRSIRGCPVSLVQTFLALRLMNISYYLKQNRAFRC